MPILDAVLVADCVIATITDMLERRILNVLTFPLVLIGVVGHACLPEEGGRLMGLYGMLAAGLPFFCLFALNVVSAGDVKLLMGIGALRGPVAAGWVMLGSVVLGGVVSFVALLMTRRLRSIGDAARHVVRRPSKPGSKESTFKGYKIPMGGVIAVSALGQLIFSLK